VTDRNGVLTLEIDVPREKLTPGPRGARVHVIDFDASTNTLYKPRMNGLDADPYRGWTDRDRMLRDPGFHAQNAYAVTMATVGWFEKALGRRAPFALPAGGQGSPGRGHVMKLAPHAFCEANAFYSRRDEGLLFGYFPLDARNNVFTCLSHDIVAHETTHAILDGLRPRFTDPSSFDQAAFHEGFADIVALLSVMRHAKVVAFALAAKNGRIERRQLTAESLKKSALFGLAEQMGSAGERVAELRGNALRRSVALDPDPSLIKQPEYREAHRRGEIFVAAMMRAFLEVWERRLKPLLEGGQRGVDATRVAEEGAHAAQHLLTMAIRAIDYTPPVDLCFRDYLTALLTADREVYPDDTRYRYREVLLRVFASYGIEPTSDGNWDRPPQVSLDRNHFDSLQRDPDEMFHFLWENREVLELHPTAFTYIASVKPCVRVDADGFTLRETIADYVQLLDVEARELKALKVDKPKDMPLDARVRLNGGGVLIFDEFGRLKYHIGTGVGSRRQSKRLEHLWEAGFFGDQQVLRRIAQLHRVRAMDATRAAPERW
jgi:hypothetical protein